MDTCEETGGVLLRNKAFSFPLTAFHHHQHPTARDGSGCGENPSKEQRMEFCGRYGEGAYTWAGEQAPQASVQTHDQLKPPPVSTTLGTVSAQATLLPWLGGSTGHRHLPKGTFPKLNLVWIPLPCVFLHCFPAGSLLPSHILSCPTGYGKIPPCLLWNQSLELGHSPDFISGALNRKLHPILCTASYRRGKNRYLMTCNLELIYKLVSSSTKVRQLPANSREWSRQSQELCPQAAEQREAGPPWHWAVRDVRSPGWADPHLTQLLRAAEHCSGWECQLGSVLAQECLHLWAAQVCKGVAKPHQLHMKQGSWGSRHFCHHNLRNFWDYYWKYSVFVSSQLSSSNFQLPVRNTEWHILTLQQ